jgi:hypothetical protein
VVERGDIGSEMFFLTAGQVEVLISLDEPPVTKLLPGASFGETALITDEPRNASIRAATDVEVYVLSKRGLHKTLEHYPDVADALEEDAWQKKSQLPIVEARESDQKLAAGGQQAPGGGDGSNSASGKGGGGLIQVTLTKGPEGFGLQVDRTATVKSMAPATADWVCPVCRVKVLASLHVCFSCQGARPPSAAVLGGVQVGNRIVAVNGHATRTKSEVVSVLGDCTKCPSRHVLFSFAKV